VKFDISMIRLLEQQNNEQYYITEEMAKIVKKAGYLSVAEGIESKTMLNRVIELGFDYAQGYLFGKP
ncbi:MAG: EAL domain-containing protein, partial [Chromatiales bacterium]|nr:EAL domain-containing protein [Chromatiales bacterium]